MRDKRSSSQAQRRGHAVFTGLCLLAGLAVAGALKPGLAKAKPYTPAFALNDQTRRAANSNAFAVVMGEVRATMADLIWVKTERYLHRGVAYGSHVNYEAMARKGEVQTNAPHADSTHQDHVGPPREEPDGHEDHAEHVDDDDEQTHDGPEQHPERHVHDEHCNHGAYETRDGHDPRTCNHDHSVQAPDDSQEEGMSTVIPEAREDYRGFVGALHRAVQPWQDRDAPHEHTSGEQLLPWYRMLTYSNPGHVRGYMTGAWWLMKRAKDQEGLLGEAEAFIKEGIENNAESFALQLMHGRVLIQREAWDEAIAACERAVELALLVRPRNPSPDSELWSESDEEDFRSALRYVPLIQWRKLGDHDSARRNVRRALAHAPNDLPLLQMLELIDQE